MTTFDEYQKAAARTINSGLNNRQVLTHGLFGLASEAGEVTGLFQKELQGHKLNTDAIMKELGDVMWMVAEICTAKGIRLEDVAKLNVEKLMQRYPTGFSAERSINRAEGDI